MTLRWLPAACTRLRIFISYSSEDRALADEIAQTLKNEGHDVFFDKDSLPPGEEYNERIRAALRMADRCIFLVSKRSIEPGKYMLTEIDFAKAKWPVPAGRVLPVVVDSGITPRDLPVYLRSVNAITPKGSIAAEIAAAIDGSRKLNASCRLCLAAAVAGIVAVAALAAWLGLRAPSSAVEIALLPVERMHFRPRAAPPPNLLAPDAATDWIESPLTITAMSVTYNRRDRGSAVATLLREELELAIGASPARYLWAYIVDIKQERGCAEDWLCRKENVEVQTLAPSSNSRARETMFLSERPLTWRAFIDQVLGSQVNDITVTLRSQIDLTGAGDKRGMMLEAVCVIDVSGARAEFLKQFKPGENPRPTFWQPPCAAGTVGAR
jgi:TIR domain-containing protein